MELTRHLDDVAYSRRRFLTGAGVVAGAVVAGRTLRGLGSSARGRAPPPRHRGEGRRRGAPSCSSSSPAATTRIDTVIPYADPRTAGSARRSRSTPRSTSTARSGLHPNLAKLAGALPGRPGRDRRGRGLPRQRPLALRVARELVVGPARLGRHDGLARPLPRRDGRLRRPARRGRSIGPGPSPALVGERSFATSISDAAGCRPGSRPGSPGATTCSTPGRGWAARRASRSDLEGQVRQAIALTDARPGRPRPGPRRRADVADDATSTRGPTPAAARRSTRSTSPPGSSPRPSRRRSCTSPTSATTTPTRARPSATRR